MSSQTEPKTICLYGHGVPHEAVASAAITPGLFVARGAGNTVAPGFGGAAMVAHEYGLTGRDINDDYSADDQVIFHTYAPGSGVYALVASGAAAIADGDMLAVQDDGTVLTAASGGVAMAQAREDVDNSAGGTPARIRVEITTGTTV